MRTLSLAPKTARELGPGAHLMEMERTSLKIIGSFTIVTERASNLTAQEILNISSDSKEPIPSQIAQKVATAEITAHSPIQIQKQHSDNSNTGPDGMAMVK